MDLWFTLWIVLINYLGTQMASALAREQPFRVAPTSLWHAPIFFFWPNKMFQVHLGLTLPRPRNQSWFLLVVLETMIWFINDIRDVLWVLSFSLKTYFGHRPNGFHNLEFEKHDSRVTHSLVTVIFWKPRPSSRWSLCIKAQLQESSGSYCRPLRTVQGCFPVVKAGLSTWQLRLWSYI